MPNLKYQWRRLRNKLKRNKIGRLPVELYLLVIEQVERKEDLYNLLFVCRDFHSAAQKGLYREVHLKHEEGHLILLQNIISCQRIAHHIQSVTISSVPHFVDKQTYFTTLSQALRTTRNLKKFFWLAHQWPLWPLPTLHFFSGCAFQLHTLVMHAREPIILDSAFNPQPELVVLDLQGFFFFKESLPPNAFPKLTALTVHCRETTRLINNPTVRAVYVRCPYTFYTPWTSSPLVTSFRLFSPNRAQLSLIQHAYPRLRFLRLDYIDVEVYSPSSPWDEGLNFVFAQISPLAALEKLALHFSPECGQVRDRITSIRHTALDHLRNLQPLIIQEDATHNYIQFSRGAAELGITEPYEEEWRDERWW